ncbi:MAG TPA: hypothetical protein VF765_24040, partial [Polyangiaceae bacterium]
AAIRATDRLLATGASGTRRIHGQFTRARALVASGSVDEGLAQARAGIAAYAGAYGPNDWHVGSAHEQLAETLVRRHLLEDADAEAAKAIEFLTGSKSEPDTLNEARVVRSLCASRRGHAAEALADAQLVANGLTADTPLSGRLLPLLAVGEAALGKGDTALALSTLERAAEAAESAEDYPELHADVHLALARALFKAGADPARARDVADRAATEYEGCAMPELARQARAVGKRE